MQFKRRLADFCLESAKKYPIVTIMGPRQSGKTTLAKSVFPDYPYINLEDPSTREIADRDPKALLNKYPDRLIIDEIQRAPALLSHIQVITDQQQRDGQYILTGSYQLELHDALVQSLAGRSSILELLPLSLSELAQQGGELTTNELLLSGFYPRLHVKNIEPAQMYRDYVKTYLERDVRRIINVKNLLQFQRFMKLCAARTGCVLNMDSLANEVGVSNKTIKEWISILQATFLVTLLTPYYENFGKQVIKSPKLYFTDVGLACHLLEIETLAQVDRDPLRGNLFETMVVMDLIKSRLNLGREPQLYYYRDSRKNEIDIIFKQGSQLIPVEIKSAQTISTSYLKRLNYFKKLVGDERCGQPCLIYAGEEEYELQEARFLNYHNAHHILVEAQQV